MARFKKLYKKKKEGKVVYGDGIVNSIVMIAIAEIPNVELCATAKPSRHDRSNAIKVKFEKQDVFVDVAVKINYQHSVSQMAFKIQEVVRHNVEAMTEYHVGGVNVNVYGVLFDDAVVEVPKVKKTKKNLVNKPVESNLAEATVNEQSNVEKDENK